MGAVRRAELTRRARPFDPDGFPVPLDRRRLSGPALAWSAAAVVLLALGMLVLLPAGGGGAVAAAPAGPALATGPRPGADDQGRPIPTLAASPFAPGVERDLATAAGGSRPASAPDRGADRRPAAPARRVATPATGLPSPAGRARDGARRRDGSPVLSVSWSPRTDAGCADGWTADLRAWLSGPEADGVTAAEATVTGADGRRTVALRPDGAQWRGQLSDLPTGRQLLLTVRAGSASGGSVESSRRIAFSCG